MSGHCPLANNSGVVAVPICREKYARRQEPIAAVTVDPALKDTITSR
jgi:hypothetical protein